MTDLSITLIQMAEELEHEGPDVYSHELNVDRAKALRAAAAALVPAPVEVSGDRLSAKERVAAMPGYLNGYDPVTEADQHHAYIVGFADARWEPSSSAASAPPQGEVERLRDAVRWALGEVGSFPEQPEAPVNAARGYGRPRFWWRTELRQRAFGPLSPPSSLEPEQDESRERADRADRGR